MRRKVVMVFAGNYQQYAEWCNAQPINEHFRYVSDLNSLRGMRGCELIRIGTWHKRKDATDIEREIMLSGLIEKIN